MNHGLYAIDLEITLEAPYLVHGNDPGRYGLDATLLRDHRGRPVLPGTLVAGRIAETWHNLGDQLDGADADLWFGIGGIAESRRPARRARLMVGDLILVDIDGTPLEQAAAAPNITRIRQNDDTGAVEPGALLIIEQVAAPGAQLRFVGTWRTWATPDEAGMLIPQLHAALLLQTQLGAYRSVGFGRIKGVSVEARQLTPMPFALDDTATHYRLALSGDRALCVGSRSRRGNVFESDDVISGGTILGTLATTLAARFGKATTAEVETPLAKHFSALRCTHALPAQRGAARPAPLPQSLVSRGDDICDAWGHKEPPFGLKQAPAFQSDWKPLAFEKAAASQRWGKTVRDLRVRTDIDGNGMARESALFAYECVAASLDERGQPATEWLFDIDLDEVPPADRSDVRQELTELLGYGLFPLGKTDAAMSVAVATELASVWPSANLTGLKAGDLVPVLLVTDALLFPTNAIADKPDADLEAIYRNAFADLAGGEDGLTLNHFFATQRLAGGAYLHRRYRKNAHYQPWVLTEAGSVFVFKVADADAARRTLQSWSKQGLGLTVGVQQAYGGTWQDHPYLPKCGYGEVAIAPQHGFTDL